MLLERNENKPMADNPATKHHALPKNITNLQKENRIPIHNPYTKLNSFKQPFEPVIEASKKDLFIVETNKIKATNLKKILGFELSKSKGNFRSDFLRKHNISSDIRVKMVS